MIEIQRIDNAKKLREYKLHALVLIEIICIFLAFLGCFREEKLIYYIQGKDMLQQEQQYSSECMRLSPGVYQVRVLSSIQNEQSMFIEMKSDTGFFQSLKGNGVNIFPNEGYTDFEVYITDTIPSAYLQCDFTGGNADMLRELSVYKLNWGSRIAAFWLIIIFALLDMMLLYRKKILEGKISVEQQVVFWVLLGGVLLTYFPYFTDYFSFGADTAYHLLRIEGLKESLLQGDMFPIRVHGYCNYGHGSLIPAFYSDLFLYIPALLRLIGFPIMSAYKMFVFMIILVTAVISYVSFKKCIQDTYAALFGSVVYLLTPYHILNFYTRGAMGEYLAMAFMPLVCCGMYLLFTREDSASYRSYKWWIVIGISAVLHCHLLSTETVVLLMAIVCAVFWKKTFCRQTFTQLLEAAMIVLVLNCWFWIPMVYLLNNDKYHVWDAFGVSIQNNGLELAGFLQLVPHEGGVRTGMYQSEPALQGAGILLMLLIYLLIKSGVFREKETRSANRERNLPENGCRAFALLTILTMCMSTRYFPWDLLERIPFIASFVTSLQFPWHFMAPGTVAGSMFAGFFFLWMGTWKEPLQRIAAGGVAALIIGSCLYHVNDIAFHADVTRLYTTENMGTTNIWNRNFMLAECDLPDLYYHEPTAENGLEYYNYVKKGTTIKLDLINTADRPLHLEIPLTGYKGYGIKHADTCSEAPYITENRGAHGDIRIAVPAKYSGTIEVAYYGLQVFHMAEWISLAGLMAVFLLIIWNRRGKGCIYRESGN